MKEGITAVLKEKVLGSYGHIRACTDEVIEYRGMRLENHARNRRNLARMLTVHVKELEQFLRYQGINPDQSLYVQKIRDLALRSDHQEVFEVPDLPTFEELIAGA
mgnify:CR=1 FL=1